MFLSSHPSLTHLDTGPVKENLEFLFPAASNLVSLETRAYEQLAHASRDPLRNLQNLQVLTLVPGDSRNRSTLYQPFTVEMFNAIIRKYFVRKDNQAERSENTDECQNHTGSEDEIQGKSGKSSKDNTNRWPNADEERTTSLAKGAPVSRRIGELRIRVTPYKEEEKLLWRQSKLITSTREEFWRLEHSEDKVYSLKWK